MIKELKKKMKEYMDDKGLNIINSRGGIGYGIY